MKMIKLAIVSNLTLNIAETPNAKNYLKNITCSATQLVARVKTYSLLIASAVFETSHPLAKTANWIRL